MEILPRDDNEVSDIAIKPSCPSCHYHATTLVAARSNPDLTFFAAGGAAGGDTYRLEDDSAKGSGSKGEKQLYAKGARKLNRNGGARN